MILPQETPLVLFGETSWAVEFLPTNGHSTRTPRKKLADFFIEHQRPHGWTLDLCRVKIP